MFPVVMLTLPVKRDYMTHEHARRFYANLCLYRAQFQEREFSLTFPNIELFRPFHFDGTYQLLLMSGSEYENIDQLADMFNERERLHARRIGAGRSPAATWSDDPEYRDRIVRLAGGSEDPYKLREAMWSAGGVPEATAFKESFAKVVIDRLGGTRILDFSAGWGSRMAAAYASEGCVRYLGVDPNERLKPGHDEMMAKLAEWKGNCDSAIVYEPFESARISERFDLVFTSPPYFDFEEYSKDSTQSLQRWPDFPSWMARWLFPAMRKAWELLEVGGNMAIHMCDPRICAPMLMFIASRLEGARYRGVLACTGVRPKPRPVWVFAKDARNEEAEAKNATWHPDEILAGCYRDIYELLEESACSRPRIRCFRESDAARVRSLYLAGMADDGLGRDPHTLRTARYLNDSSNVLGWYDNVWVAEADEQLVGCVAVRQGEVYLLQVVASHRRRGIGSRLMSRLHRYCAMRGIGEIGLRTVAEHRSAIPFYEKLGYTLTARSRKGVLTYSRAFVWRRS